MSFLKNLLGGSSEGKTITANILDPMHSGTIREVWTVGDQITSASYENLSDKRNIYVLVAYDKGVRKLMFLKKPMWDMMRAQHELMDQELERRKEETKRMFEDLGNR